MLRILKRYPGFQAHVLDSSLRQLSAVSNGGLPPEKEDSKDSQPQSSSPGSSSEDIKKGVSDRRKWIMDQDDEINSSMSTYDKLKKLYLEKEVNAMDADIALKRGEYKEENPFQRTHRVLLKDFQSFGKILQGKPYRRYMGHSDILIIGNGIAASVTAIQMKTKLPRLEVTVVEEDSHLGAEPLGVSGEGLMMQWDLPHYVSLANLARMFYQCLPSRFDGKQPTLEFSPCSSLQLATSSGVQALSNRIRMYNDVGWTFEEMRTVQLQRRFPWLNTDGIELAVQGMGAEGWFDPWTTLALVKRLSYESGVRYVKGTIQQIGFSIMDSIEKEDGSTGDMDHPRIVLVRQPDGTAETLDFSSMVLAAGLRNNYVAKQLGIGTGDGSLRVPLPLRTAKRYMYKLRCPNAPVIDFPLIIDPSGIKIRRDGLLNQYICWRNPSPEEEPDIRNLDVDMTYFKEKIQPALVKRIPAFKDSEVVDSWAGFVDVNSYDGAPIIGFHPTFGHIYLMVGLGADEMLMAPGLAAAAADAFIESSYDETVDLTAFLFDRVLYNDRVVKQSVS